MANNLGQLLSGQSQNKSKGPSLGKTYGKVVDIILDTSHPRYKEKGSLKSLNGIFYEGLGGAGNEEEGSDPKFAYSSNSNIVKVPVVGEVVKIESQPTQSEEGFGLTTKQYYTSLINYWNSPNTNTYLDTTKNQLQDISQKGTFEESPAVNPLRPSPGDVYFLGRQGQSIRFTGAIRKGYNVVDKTNLGEPLTIISNGQKKTEDGFTPIDEDINEDGVSIYLASDHKLDLRQASEKQDTFNEPYKKVKNFKGEQGIATGGRIVINASKNDVLVFAKENAAVSVNKSIGLDAGEDIGLDAKKIYLGKGARTASSGTRQSVLLGNKTEDFLEKVLTTIESISKSMATATTIDGKAIPLLNKEGTKSTAVIKLLKNRINPNGPSYLKSKKVFTE